MSNILDNITMNGSLSTLFKGQAYFKVLEILSQCVVPLRLRTISGLSNMHVRSIEIALAYFIKQGVVTRVKKDGQKLYCLRSEYPMVSLLRQIFSLISEYEKPILTTNLDKKAQDILRFSDSTIKLFQRVKR